MVEKLEPIDPKSFWQVMGMRAVGSAVVTAQASGQPAGFLALSVTHLTQTPPSLMLSIGKTTSALATIRASGFFAVNFLAADDTAMAEVFGGRSDLKGSDRFQPERWHELLTGAPALKGAIGTIECRLVDEIERFETCIAIGKIVNWTSDKSKRPLIHFAGGMLDQPKV